MSVRATSQHWATVLPLLAKRLGLSALLLSAGRGGVSPSHVFSVLDEVTSYVSKATAEVCTDQVYHSACTVLLKPVGFYQRFPIVIEASEVAQSLL